MFGGGRNPAFLRISASKLTEHVALSEAEIQSKIQNNARIVHLQLEKIGLFGRLA